MITMPPANMQWTDPLVQADECITHSRIGESNSRPDVVRRITPKSKHDTLPKQCEAGCDLSPQGSPTRYWQMGQRKRRKRKSARMLTSSRTINATLWMIIVVGLLYCRRGLDRPASSSWPAEHEQQKDMDALPAISTAMYLDQRFTRKLRAETIVQQDSQQIIHIIHTRYVASMESIY